MVAGTLHEHAQRHMHTLWATTLRRRRLALGVMAAAAFRELHALHGIATRFFRQNSDGRAYTHALEAVLGAGSIPTHAPRAPARPHGSNSEQGYMAALTQAAMHTVDSHAQSHQADDALVIGGGEFGYIIVPLP